MLIPVYKNIRHEVWFGAYKLTEVYCTRWGWYVRADRSKHNRRRFTTKEEAEQVVIKEARGA